MKKNIRKNSVYWIATSFLLIINLACSTKNTPVLDSPTNEILIANVETDLSVQFQNIQKQFAKNNPGYTIDYVQNTQLIEKNNENRILFIQKGGGTIDMNGHASSKFSIGDIILLRPADQIYADSLFSGLIISSPDMIPKDIPPFVRPDWDPNITDVPGGCATETNAYRRILLTWKKSVGTYVYHSVNAHRVRIMDSFTHFHPIEGGFDEFYLVQMAAPTAKLLTSHHVKDILKPQSLSEEKVDNLIESHSLKVGDLVYLPKGVMHRGLGNALVQVITVPGFIPGAEIGLDHHLFALHKRFNGLNVPYNKEASVKSIVK